MTARQPSPNAQFAAFLSRFPPEIVALVKRCLPKRRRAFPGSYQLVYDYSNSLVVAFGMSERGYEAIVAIAIFPRWVRLYFDKSLPDPKGLLEGSGAKVRSVTLKAALDLDHGYPGTHQGCDQARRGHLPAHPLDPHGHQVGVEEAETEENRARLTRRCS
ncbi:MAG TPA: hypothetical protein VKE40_08555 [Gemmataceae bacterium]|nr:hypothetical protein [Gemmataceae bacterium]